MPITYSNDTELRIVRVKWYGTVTAADLAAYFRRMLSDAESLSIGRCMADLRGAKLRLTGSDICAIVGQVVRPLLGDRTWISAIIARDPVAFGTSRQFEEYSRGFNSARIFDDELEALAWLLSADYGGGANPSATLKVL